MNTDEKIVIAVASDNHYLIMVAALLKSIEVNHKSGELIEAWIIEDNIPKKRKKKLEDSLDLTRMHIRWINNKEVIPPGVQLPSDRTSYPLNIFMRIFIPHFIPEGTRKVLYLDVDMVVNTDISKLWYTDIDNYVMAAATDSICVYIKNNVKNYKELGLPGDSKYFNSGLLLINIKKWLEKDITRKVIQTINENRKYSFFGDQYGLNVNLVDQWYELDPLWNYYASGDHPEPYIVHYFHRKPFYTSYFNNPFYKELFYNYLNQTKWKGTKPVGELRRYIKKGVNIIEKIPVFLKNKFKA